VTLLVLSLFHQVKMASACNSKEFVCRRILVEACTDTLLDEPSDVLS
jgi:hypothetical protein